MDADAYMRLLWVQILNLVVLRMSDQTYFALEGISSTIFCPVKKKHVDCVLLFRKGRSSETENTFLYYVLYCYL